MTVNDAIEVRTEDLKPCPFCGCAAELRQGIVYASVICTCCDAKSATCDGINYVGKARDVWNGRQDK